MRGDNYACPRYYGAFFHPRFNQSSHSAPGLPNSVVSRGTYLSSIYMYLLSHDCLFCKSVTYKFMNTLRNYPNPNSTSVFVPHHLSPSWSYGYFTMNIWYFLCLRRRRPLLRRQYLRKSPAHWNKMNISTCLSAKVRSLYKVSFYFFTARFFILFRRLPSGLGLSPIQF